MLRLITALGTGLVPRPLHRTALRAAHRLRHRWRVLRKVPLQGVSVIAHDRQGRVLMVRHSYARPGWAFPGGGCKRGENPQEAARRELQEELGVTLEGLHLLDRIEETISGSPHTAFVYSGLVAGAINPDGREVVEARLFATDALPDDMSLLTKRRLQAFLQQR